MGDVLDECAIMRKRLGMKEGEGLDLAEYRASNALELEKASKHTNKQINYASPFGARSGRQEIVSGAAACS
jgi:hypothetical protein